MLKQFAIAAGVATLAAIVAGCSAPAEQPAASPPNIESFDTLVNWQIEQAQAGGASDAQVAVLKEAAAAGSMSHELALQSARDFMDCLQDVGIRAELGPDTETGEYPKIHYRIYAEDLTVSDQCLIKTYDFVDTVYQLQPAVQQHGRDIMDAHADDFIECLTDAGVDVPVNVSDRALAGAVYSASQGIQPFADGNLTGGPIDCLTPFGLTVDDF